MNTYIKQILSLYQEKRLDKAAAHSLIETYQKLHEGRQDKETKVAIIGYSCRMPLAANKELFWHNLKNGVNAVHPFPASRRKDTDHLVEALAKNKLKPGKKYWDGGFLDDVDLFDNEFFRILPKEAQIMDPQQRLFLELAHEAFEDAGYSRKKLKGTNTAVFLGDVINEYRKIVPEVTASAVVGNISPFITSRVSYFYDLHGPTVNISTTCSTSLVAIHEACQAVIAGECDMALAGAINLRLFPFELQDDPIDALGITSEDGVCRAFDNKANGIVRGEGGGAIVFKSYEKAVRDRDHIYAVVLASSVNNDGRSSSVGAPNPFAQQELLKETWKKAGISPRTLDYFEAHGTGTKIGDPIEIQAITKAVREFTQERQFCGLGSVKTNLGHLTGGASGLAGLIKVLLALEHKEIPPTLHFEEPNDLIDFASSPIYITDKLQKWQQSEHPRRAAVSAFGFNGTNCHMVVEEHVQEQAPVEEGPFLWVFSHASSDGLMATLERHKSYYTQYRERLTAAGIAYTLAVGRDHYSCRTVILAGSYDKALDALNSAKGPGLVNLEALTVPQIAHDYLHGVDVDWEEYYKKSKVEKVPLPAYYYERKRFWIESSRFVDEDKEFVSTTSVEITYESPEEQLRAIFKTVMGLDTIDSTSSFFELGGDSLLGVQLINQIHKQFNKKISFQELFDKPRICDLLPLITESEEKSYSGIRALARMEHNPLSYGQRRLWILHQMQDNPIAYNMYDCYRFEGSLDVAIFKKALNQLIIRHESLRTVFKTVDGQPYQQVLEPFEFPLTLDDSGDKSLIDIFKTVPFDLEHGPLIKALLIKERDGSYLFFIVMHHIISDGTSLKVIFDDILKSYQGIELPKLSISYVDYSHWQKSNALSSMQAFWKEKFAGNLPVCELAGDRSRPAVFNFIGARRLYRVPQKHYKQLQELVSQRNATLFMGLLASIYALIYRYTGQRDIIVGSPVSGRSHYDLRGIVGFFVNTLALRVKLDADDTFETVLAKTRADVLASVEHQDYPFDHLVDELNLPRDTSRSPLFNINVALQNFDLDEESKKALSALKVSRQELSHHSCKWDLEFEFIKRSDDTLDCYVEYYHGVYSEQFVDLLFTSYLGLLEDMLKEPVHALSHIIISPNAAAVVDRAIEQSVGAYETVHGHFEAQVGRTPNAPAVDALSYSELNKRANQLAHFLKNQKKVAPEEPVGIYMENSQEVLVAILAVLKAGGCYVPIDSKAPLERAKSIIEQAQIRTVISKRAYLYALNRLQWDVPTFTSYICLDTNCLLDEVEEKQSSLMDEELWNQVADESGDDISSSGWVSSETGLAFSRKEMDEYRENIVEKLLPHLSATSRVLEVGCGSGLTLFSLCSHVREYVGLDLSAAIIEKNRCKAEREQIKNVQFYTLSAHEVDKLDLSGFDCVIFNSVIHCFPGVNYLQAVLKKVIAKMNDQAILFLGDLMDQGLKGALIDWMSHCKIENKEKGLRTKTDWSNELFIAREFLEDLQGTFGEITSVTTSLKRHTVQNELTRFRYDAILGINKKQRVKKHETLLHKQQHDLQALVGQPTENLNLVVPSHALAYVLFTSGSTGKPKGVMVEHRTVVNYLLWCIKEYYKDLPEPCNTHFYSPVTFDLTVTSLFCPLFTGGSIQTHSGEFDAVLQKIIDSKHGNILKLTPTHLTMMVEMNRSIPHIKKFILGGEALYSAKVHQFKDLYDGSIQVYNEYGPTEATVGCVVYEWNTKSSDDPVQLPIGAPISNAVISLRDEKLLPVPVGVVGEIYIGGKCLARGYLNNSALTAEKFVQDAAGQIWYRTGDLGRLLPNNTLEYVGRNDRQVKIRGFRIELNEIEGTLLQHPAVKEVAVVVRDDEHRGKILSAYFTSDTSVSVAELREWLAKSLPEYMIPACFMQVESIGHTSNAKVDYLRLPNAVQESVREITEPRSREEASLVAIWAQVLGVEKENISIFDDFFELGGDSIIAMRILPKARGEGIALSIKDIFQYRTIAALCQHCAPVIKDLVDQGEVVGSCSLTPVQRWFFEQQQPHPEYFNMAYLFAIPSHTNSELLEEAIHKVLQHHDVLRSVFKQVDGSYVQEILPASAIQFALKEVGPDASQDTILQVSEELQSGFSLEEGPLFAAAVFDMGKEGKRLFIAIHHLIIDGVSWRYLVEDIEALYRNPQAKLAPKTHSFIEYSKAVSCMAKGPLQLDYWHAIEPGSYFELALAGPKKHKETALVFDKAFTKELLECRVNDVLLTALFLAVAEQFGQNALLFNHEGHGRHPLGSIDILRTAGWMTTIYPLVLKKQDSLSQTYLHVKNTLQALSSCDHHYGIARYLAKDKKLEALAPQFLFNYFGRVGADLVNRSSSLLTNCQETFAPVTHRENSVPHLLEVNAIIMEDILQLSIVYETATFSESQIEQLKGQLKKNILEIIGIVDDIEHKIRSR